MILSSRALALILAIAISIITTAFLSLTPDISNTALLIAFGLSFSSTYILVHLFAEFLFFKEINNIYDVLKSIQNNEIKTISTPYPSTINPLKRVNREIKKYTQQKQKEIEELKRMETFRREFIADVSHELKTPIFAAQGFVHTLLDGAVEDKKVRGKFLKKAAKSLDGLDALVQDLLTISQMETGEIKMHFEYFDIVELCREVYDQVEVKADKKKVQLSFDEDYEVKMFVYADYQRIYQVVSNLVTNGIKYTKEGGFVKIRISEDDENVEVSVQDNGRGIPNEDIGRIFERFYRVDKSRSKEKGGTGLGLSIVKHIMEGHHAKIEVESKYKVGSRFWFKLKRGEPVTTKPVWGPEEDEE
ncbi:MAG: ATP-binding protein [Cyclobacteriaceae bacterium]|nr:ATP-binding protein [Cyclobacteriaceae bacterium HetDA_MAG_MS6]